MEMLERAPAWTLRVPRPIKGWVEPARRLPTRCDADESGFVWVDDGVEVACCYWARVAQRTDVRFWMPRLARRKPKPAAG